MSCDSPEQWTWGGIPDRSTLEVRLESDTEDYNLTAILYEREGDEPIEEEEWDRDELDPGPKCRELRSPKVYRLELTVRYPGSSEDEVRVRARVLDPEGNEFGSAYCRELEREEDDLHRVRLSLLMEVPPDTDDADGESDG